MKSQFVIGAMLLLPAFCTFQVSPGNFDVPQLGKINQTTLSPSYGCHSNDDATAGYKNTALFLTNYSRERNSPELLFEGACKAPDYFIAATAGDHLDVIADYGVVPLERLTASDVFGRRRSTDSIAEFRQTIRIQAGHTYGVLINKSTARGFFFFRVADYVPNQRLDLQYVVMDYSIIREELRAPGFDWRQRSHL